MLIKGIYRENTKNPVYWLKRTVLRNHPEFEKRFFIGERLGIYEVNNPYASIEARGEEEFRMAEGLINNWAKNA